MMRSIKRRHATVHGDRKTDLGKDLFARPDILPTERVPDPIKLNLLAMRRGDKTECEMCGNFSTLLCAVCKVTYYCSNDHYELDRQLHTHLCSALATLRTPIPFSSSPDTRERMKKQYDIRLREICNFTYLKAMVALVEGQYEFAIAAARTSFKTANEAFGASPATILPKTVLTESFLKLNRFQEAQQTLVDCLRIETVLGDISNKVRAMVRRSEGLFALSQQQTAHARFCFAEEVYLYAEEYNPEHIRTASGYANLGETFIDEDTTIAKSLIRKSVGIWTKHFGDKLKETSEQLVPVYQSLPDTATIRVPLTASVSMTSRNEKDKAASEKIMQSCDVQAGLNTLSYCNSLLRQMFGSNVEISDQLEIAFAKAQILFSDFQLFKVKSKVGQALQMCEENNLEDWPIYKQLLKLNKDTDKILQSMKKSKGIVRLN